MAKFTVRSRQGAGDTFRKVGEIDAPVKPDGSHYEYVLKAHLATVKAAGSVQTDRFNKQFVVQHNQSGDLKLFRVNVEPVVTEL